MIVKIIISSILFALAALFNAIMDISNFKPERFKREWWKHDPNRKYIDGDSTKGRVKWFGNVNKPVQIQDGFHFSKMVMVMCIAAALIILASSKWWHYLIGLPITYILWNGIFMAFYKYKR